MLEVLRSALGTARASLVAAHPVVTHLRRSIDQYRDLDPQSSLALGLLAQVIALETCLVHYAPCTAAAVKSARELEPAF